MLLQGPMTQIRTVSIGEKRQPVNHTTVSKTLTSNTSTSKPTTGTRWAVRMFLVLRCVWKPCIKAKTETMWNIVPGNHVAKPRSVERCMAWRRGTCGAQRAAGRRPASASLTEIYALSHFKTCSFHGLSAGVSCTLSEWTSWAEMCPSEACGHLKCHWFLQATRGALFLPLP